MITVGNLTKKFGDFAALDQVSFRVEEGETFALLGPNGSGKTTALKSITGLARPTDGQILIDGFDVWKQSREAKKRLSYLPQHLSFHETLTAREVLMFYCRLRRIDSSRIDEVLERANLNGFTDKPVSQFSGGMIQRLGLAVACLPDVPILVLDEPTISLDPQGAVRFREFLAELKREGKTIIFSSHMLADVEQLADRVAILVGGRLIALDTIDGLREKLVSGCRMQIVLSNANEKFSTVALRAGADGALIDGDSLWLASRPEMRMEILREIESAGGRIARLATQELSLEDIYMRYIDAQEDR